MADPAQIEQMMALVGVLSSMMLTVMQMSRNNLARDISIAERFGDFNYPDGEAVRQRMEDSLSGIDESIAIHKKMVQSFYDICEEKARGFEKTEETNIRNEEEAESRVRKRLRYSSSHDVE